MLKENRRNSWSAIGGIIYNATTMIISYIAIKKYTPIIIKKSSIIKPILASTIMTIISKMIFEYLILSTKLSDSFNNYDIYRCNYIHNAININESNKSK